MSQYFNNVFNYPTSASYFVQQQHAALQRQQQQKQILQHQQQQQPMLQQQQQQTQQNKNDTNQPQEKDKPKRDRWTPEQNQILVSMYVENYEALESSNCNKVWPKILESVCNYGPKKTLKQIKVKVRNMKDAYKKCKDENNSTFFQTKVPV